MGEVVNLRQARKRADRRSKEAAAEANRVTFGLSTKVKTRTRAEARRQNAALDGHRLEKDGAPSGDD